MKIGILLIVLLTFGLTSFNCRNSSVSALPDNDNLQIRKKNDIQLVEAVKSENAERVKQLLESGANPNSTYRKSETSDSTTTVLGLAVENKNVEIARLLLEHGADVDRSRTGFDYLNFRIAINNQDVKMAKLLVSFDAKTNDDSSPMIRDVKNEELLEFLINRGFDINSQDIDGRTCLTEAVFARDLEMVKAILKHKPNLNLKTKPLKVLDYKEMTVLQIAKAYNNKDIIQELKKAGAK
jgi:uncharacterized protein